MLNVSCDSSKEIELERGLGAGTGVDCALAGGFLKRAAGNEHFGGVCEIGDCRRDIMNDRSYTILVPPGVVE